MAASIFLLSAVIFFFNTAASENAADPAMENQFDRLFELISFIMEAHPLVSILLVFMNNFISMAQMLLLGVVAGISPLVTMGINGALVGVMFSLTVEQGIPLLPIIIFGILPHGIFELFAFFLCGALGLKFGYHCIASPLPGKTRMQSYRFIWKEVISVLPLVVLLLIAAAFIEVLLTPRLLQLIL